MSNNIKIINNKILSTKDFFNVIFETSELIKKQNSDYIKNRNTKFNKIKPSFSFSLINDKNLLIEKNVFKTCAIISLYYEFYIPYDNESKLYGETIFKNLLSSLNIEDKSSNYYISMNQEGSKGFKYYEFTIRQNIFIEDEKHSNVIQLNNNIELLNDKNLLDLFNLFIKYKSLDNMNNIKEFRSLFFNNSTLKEFNLVISQLEKDNEVIIERTKSNAIKSILLNDNKNLEVSNNRKIINELKSKGIIKNLDNSIESEMKNEFNFRIYNFEFFENFKTTLHYKNDELKLHISSDPMLNMINSLKELSLFESFKNELQKKFDSKLKEFEEVLSLKFKNKPILKYDESTISIFTVDLIF